LPEWPSDDHRTRIVFITHDIERSVIERSFSAFMQAQAIERDMLERKKNVW